MVADGRTGPLTERQHEVLTHVARGRSNREIAAELGISEDGVKAHLSRLFQRFGVTNRVELLAAANAAATNDRANTQLLPLGDLRAIAGRANVAADGLRTNGGTARITSQLTAVRDALAAVDLALEVVHELPPNTTGPLVAALRKRLAAAFEALESAELTAQIAN